MVTVAVACQSTWLSVTQSGLPLACRLRHFFQHLLRLAGHAQPVRTEIVQHLLAALQRTRSLLRSKRAVQHHAIGPTPAARSARQRGRHQRPAGTCSRSRPSTSHTEPISRAASAAQRQRRGGGNSSATHIGLRPGGGVRQRRHAIDRQQRQRQRYGGVCAARARA